ncbi:MAG: FMN-binding protein [Candidatus Delongbacteria bacterium]|nr:FMN-binding protein [Candidatus Delongbacteria bacterium]
MQNDIIRYSLILMLITSISVAILAYLNQKTQPLINLQKQKETRDAVMEVLPAGSKIIEEIIGTSGQPGYFIGYSDESRQIINGYAILCKGKGYSSDSIQTLVGTDTSFTITGTKVIFQKETPGLGDKIGLSGKYGGKKQIWTHQFTSLAADRIRLNKDHPGQPGAIEALTGATISSRAVTSSIITGLNQLKIQVDKRRNSL